MQQSYKYVIITAARDEEEHIRREVESVVAQTVLPTTWMIVDDGSEDATADIARSFASRHPWIHVVTRDNRGYRQYAGGDLEAFYHGLAELGSQEWDYLAKLDADLSFKEDYFEQCLQHFARDPKLGIGGGKVLNLCAGKLVFESHPRFHVRGATKIYRRECWEAIGGLPIMPGWETIDEVLANMFGWKTCTFDQPVLIHHRITGGAFGAFQSNLTCGAGCYFVGYHPLFLMARAVNLLRGSGIRAAAGLLFGFIREYVRRTPRVIDPKVVRYVRQQQLNRLFFRKSIWK